MLVVKVEMSRNREYTGILMIEVGEVDSRNFASVRSWQCCVRESDDCSASVSKGPKTGIAAFGIS